MKKYQDKEKRTPITTPALKPAFKLEI